MSLTGLLDVVARDAALAEAIEAATATGAAAGAAAISTWSDRPPPGRS